MAVLPLLALITILLPNCTVSLTCFPCFWFILMLQRLKVQIIQPDNNYKACSGTCSQLHGYMANAHFSVIGNTICEPVWHQKSGYVYATFTKYLFICLIVICSSDVNIGVILTRNPNLNPLSPPRLLTKSSLTTHLHALLAFCVPLHHTFTCCLVTIGLNFFLLTELKAL